jgi:hypothetical protein
MLKILGSKSVLEVKERAISGRGQQKITDAPRKSFSIEFPPAVAPTMKPNYSRTARMGVRRLHQQREAEVSQEKGAFAVW